MVRGIPDGWRSHCSHNRRFRLRYFKVHFEKICGHWFFFGFFKIAINYPITKENGQSRRVIARAPCNRRKASEHVSFLSRIRLLVYGAVGINLILVNAAVNCLTVEAKNWKSLLTTTYRYDYLKLVLRSLRVFSYYWTLTIKVWLVEKFLFLQTSREAPAKTFLRALPSWFGWTKQSKFMIMNHNHEWLSNHSNASGIHGTIQRVIHAEW